MDVGPASAWCAGPAPILAWSNGRRKTPSTEEQSCKTKDGTKVTRKTCGGGKGGAEVVLVDIEGGGHTWPGRETGPGPPVPVLSREGRGLSPQR